MGENCTGLVLTFSRDFEYEHLVGVHEASDSEVRLYQQDGKDGWVSLCM